MKRGARRSATDMPADTPGGTEATAAVEAGPRAFTLELTKGCNLRCGYCYYAGRDDAYDPRTRMSPEVARRSVDVLFEDAPAGEPVHLHFFGGEPLLAFPLLCDTVLYAEGRSRAERKPITFEVTTNGTRLTPEVVRFLNEHRFKVGVSFDGPPDVQDVARPAAGASSYALALPGIRRLLASRRGTELEDATHCSVVVTRRAADLVRIVAHLEEIGFPRILLTPATDCGSGEEGFRDEDLPALLSEYDRLAARYERALRAGRPTAETWFPGLMRRLLSGERRTSFCGGGRDYLGVAADGEVSLCYRFYEDEEFSMGSVQEGIEREVTRRLERHALEERTACSRCWARWFCGGGCHHDNVTAGGGLGEPNPVTCDVFRHGMGRTLEIWGRLSREGALERRAPAGDDGGAMAESEPRASFSPRDRPRRVDGCHVRELEGEVVVYDPATHEVSVLNRTAALVLELCDGARTVEQLHGELVRRFDAHEDVLRRDLEACLAELAARRLLRA